MRRSSGPLLRATSLLFVVALLGCNPTTSLPIGGDGGDGGAEDAPPVLDSTADDAPVADTGRLDTSPPEDRAPPRDVPRPVVNGLGGTCDPTSPGGPTCVAGLECYDNVAGGLCTRSCTSDAQCGTTGGVANRCTPGGLCALGCTLGAARACARADHVCAPGATGAHCAPDCRAGSNACPTGTACDAATGYCAPPAGTRRFYEPCGGALGACDATGICSEIRGATTQNICFADCTTSGTCPSSPPGARCVLTYGDGRRACAIPCSLTGANTCPSPTRCVNAGGGGGVCAISCRAGEACSLAGSPCRVGRAVCDPTPSCMDAGPAPDGTACGTGMVCNGGSCAACAAGTTCTPPSNPCHTGRTSCATGTSVCNDTGSNAADGTACGAGRVCAAGTCVACAPGASCAPARAPCHLGRTVCRATGADCVDLGTNAPNGTACGAAMVCSAGTCVACAASMACAPSAAPCHVGMISCATGAPVCVDTGANAADGASCGTGRTCTAGRCGCAAGFTACGAACANLQTDASHCGFCGVACPAGRVCVEGACRCPTGQTLCGSACIDTATSNSHCGRCGTVCPGGATCTAGACVCSGGRSICAGACTDTRVTATHCGACGTACPTGQVCFDRACRAPIADLSARRGSHGAVALPDRRILVVGGAATDASGADASGRVEVYDPVANAWSTVAPLPTPRSHAAVALGTDGRVYVLGGFRGGTASNVVEAYDPATSTWSARAAMPTARGNLTAATLPDGRIYVFGGGNCGVGFTRQVEVYVPRTDSWGTAPGAGVSASLAAAATGSDGRIYLFGGYASCYSSPSVMAFDPATGTATAAGTIPTGIYAGAATTVGTSIYFGGGIATRFDPFGSSSFYTVASFYRYDVATRTVTPLYDLPAAVGRHALVGHPDGRIYAIGGSASASFTSSTVRDVSAYAPALDQWWR